MIYECLNECNLKEETKGNGLTFNNLHESWNITLCPRNTSFLNLSKSIYTALNFNEFQSFSHPNPSES